MTEQEITKLALDADTLIEDYNRAVRTVNALFDFLPNKEFHKLSKEHQTLIEIQREVLNTYLLVLEKRLIIIKKEKLK